MTAADTSTWVAYFEGADDEDTDLLDQALAGKQVVMPPAVLTELLSNPRLGRTAAESLIELPLIEISEGYWERASLLRAKVIAKRMKARLGDALISQSCIDAGVALITRDRDFLAFARSAGLSLAADL